LCVSVLGSAAVLYRNTRIEPQSLESGRFTFSALRVKIRARIFKLLRGPGIDSKESILPAYVAWRAGMNIPNTVYEIFIGTNVTIHFLFIIILSFLLFSLLGMLFFILVFEKLRDAHDKTLVCKNRKSKKIV
jgi:hypothetical protein